MSVPVVVCNGNGMLQKPVYVELCARPPSGRSPQGIENTNFKTDTAEGSAIAFQSKVGDLLPCV